MQVHPVALDLRARPVPQAVLDSPVHLANRASVRRALEDLQVTQAVQADLARQATPVRQEILAMLEHQALDLKVCLRVCSHVSFNHLSFTIV